MSTEGKNKSNKIEAKLDSIILLLKDLVALELRKRKRTRKEIREVLKMDNNRVISLLKEIKEKKKEKKK